MSLDINLNLNLEKEDDEGAEHIPVVPYDVQREKEKEAVRKLAEELRKKTGVIQAVVTTKDGIAKKANELTIEEQEFEFVRCATNPIYFIETYLTIFDQTQGKGGQIVRFKLFDFQKKLIKSYMDNRFVVANKYRQAGVSTTTCAYIAWYVMFNQNRQVAIVADKLETARDEIMSDVVLFIESCPEWLRPKTGRDVDNKKNLKDTQKDKIYDNNSRLGAFSSKGLRGMTPTLIFWDETAWTEKGDKFWTAARPTLGTGGGAIMVSCVTKDTFLFTNKGIKQIKDFIPNEELGAHVIDEYCVLGKDKLRKGNLFFNNGFVDTLRIKTTFTELESSYNHKYWAYKIKDNKYNWYKASELELDDYISIQYGMNIWGNNDDCSNFKPTITNKCKSLFNPTKISKDIAYFIGLYISEGCGNKRNNRPHQYYGITITCGDDVSQALKNLNLNYYNKDELHYEIGSLNVSEFFEYLGFDLSKRAKEKIIPTRLLEMSRENIVAMIQGIMDGDGWSTFKKRNNQVSVGIRLSSKELIDQLRILFGNFGILTDYRDSITPPTKLIKVESRGYCITATNSFAIKYFNEIGFRFERKQIKKTYFDYIKQKHSGVVDNIPNGKELMRKIYDEIKYYGVLQKLQSEGIKIETWINRKKQDSLPSSRKTLLKIIELEKNNISKDLLNELKPIIADNLYWIRIKSIKKSENYTYDFSLPNDVQEEYDFHHSMAYNQVVTHNTPSGLDAVFYKTFDGARRGENNFKAVELWWYNDPRYNKGLEWVKNKGKENEIRIVDEDWSNEKRIQMAEELWEATSPWFEEQVRDANGDMRKISQELLCSFLGSGDNFIAEEYLLRIQEHEILVPIKQEYMDLGMWIWEDPILGEDYIIGIDASPGHGEDSSTINILKVKQIIEEKLITKGDKVKKAKIRRNKVYQVAEYMGKIVPQVLAEVAYQFARRYNNAYVVVDITGGYGVQTVEKLLEFGYENVHYAEVTHKPSRDRLQGYIKKGQKTMADGASVNVDLIPGFFIGNTRSSVVLEMQRAIHMEDVIIRSFRLLNELKTFVTVPGNRVADHKRSFHDDSIMGLAIALYVLNYDMARYKQSKGVTEHMLNAIMTVNDFAEMDKRMNSGNTKTVNFKNKPMISPDSVSPLNPYGVNSWLFDGLKDKKKT